MWIMWCTCDADRAALVTSLSHRVTKESYDDLLTTECQYILCTRTIVKEMDAIHSITPSVDFNGE